MLCPILYLQGQVQQPKSTTTKVLSWKKTTDSTYTLFDAKGKQIRNAKELNRLRTDTLSYLDQDSRILYLLPDCVDADVGSSGKLSVLKRNIGKDFYITNEKSFATYIDDESYNGEFVNMDGNYIYYIEEFDKTFFHKDIRKFPSWGARNLEELPKSPDNAYWYRNSETKNYWVIVKGDHLDYDVTRARRNGDDVIILIDDKPTYNLPGYYTMASYVVKPVELYEGNTEEPAKTGCVYGNCDYGWGKWQYDDGNYYDGFWSNGLKNGYGLYSWKGIGQYIGNWENDGMNGYGAYLPDNDNDMVGQFRNGELDGLGYEITDDVWRRGVFVNGVLSEEFTYARNEGELGCTSGDCQDKYGSYWLENGDNFIGFFKNGKMHQGSYKFANGDRYVGMFNEKEEFHGMGRYFFESGAYYGGEWKNGKYHGRGYYEDVDETPQIGEWTEGVLTKVYKTSN
ncbi:hypothetical protein J1N09_09205 [Aureitalea sp. L0-47]|uniref:hypothetical protein n=1 Tax=Aureitalea sp. L0-47 TaxID=2816962 RepID=UPI002238AECE|nr:hypothetical protein [Aureitalea sp. L0-47]MCW5520014.1 hypothetical protein [Aureitalea sp. L0-47]